MSKKDAAAITNAALKHPLDRIVLSDSINYLETSSRSIKKKLF